MTTDLLIEDLRRRGVQLALAGENLKYRAPRGVLGPADREALARHKAEILAILGRGDLTGTTTTPVHRALDQAPPSAGMIEIGAPDIEADDPDDLEVRARSGPTHSGEFRSRSASQYSHKSHNSSCDPLARQLGEQAVGQLEVGGRSPKGQATREYRRSRPDRRGPHAHFSPPQAVPSAIGEGPRQPARGGPRSESQAGEKPGPGRRPRRGAGDRVGSGPDR